MRDIAIDQTPVASRTAPWPARPADMHLRLWPEHTQSGDSFNASFRYRMQGQSCVHGVRVERKRRNIPLTHAQYRFWDELRTELVLTPRQDHWHLWTGMTVMPTTIDQPNRVAWDQSHVFFFLRNQTQGRWEIVIDQHYDAFSHLGRWAEHPNYLDWRMNGQNPL